MSTRWTCLCSQAEAPGLWQKVELQGALAAEFAEGAVLAQTVHGKNTEASLHVESVRAVHKACRAAAERLPPVDLSRP